MTWLSSLWHRIYAHSCAILFPSRREPSNNFSAKPAVKQHPRIFLPLKKPINPPTTAPLALLSLPDDILFQIVRHVTHSDNDNPARGLNAVEQQSYASAVGLSETCQKLSTMFYDSLDNVCLSACPVSDEHIQTLARRTPRVLRRIVLRACTSITNDSLVSLATHSQRLCSIDLSFVSSINDTGIISLCSATAPRLRKLLLRKCDNIGDRALRAIGHCTVLETLDLSYCRRITDTGMYYVATGCGTSLRLLAVAHNTTLSDHTFAFIGKHCRKLLQFCARGLPYVTDVGFVDLCSGIGPTVEGIDVTLCSSLTRDATLRALRNYCTKIYANIMPAFAARSLRQVIISTLRQNIFIVHGSDPVTGNDTVHTVLIDNGDIVSASLLSSGTTDLSQLGIVLCKSYGSGLNDDTKKMLEQDYGIPTSSLTD